MAYLDGLVLGVLGICIGLSRSSREQDTLIRRVFLVKRKNCRVTGSLLAHESAPIGITAQVHGQDRELPGGSITGPCSLRLWAPVYSHSRGLAPQPGTS